MADINQLCYIHSTLTEVIFLGKVKVYTLVTNRLTEPIKFARVYILDNIKKIK